MSEKLTIIYSEPQSKGSNVLNQLIAKCPHCGKESPVDPKHVGRNWPKYVDPWRQAAEEANPLLPHEIAAEEAVRLALVEYETAQGDCGKLERKLRKARGKTLPTSNGSVVVTERDQRLVDEQEPLRTEAIKKLDVAGEALRAARVENNELHEARAFRIQQWKAAKQAELSGKRRRSKAGSDWSRRLREILEG